MRSINHALTGALIGLTIAEPLVAVPLAVSSHYVLDVIPHYSPAHENANKLLRSKMFKNMIWLDAIACFILVVVLGVARPANWMLAAVCAFAGAAPDFLSFNRYIKTVKHKKWQPGWHSKFASWIQWFERPIGGVVEIVWFVAAIILIAPFLK